MLDSLGRKRMCKGKRRPEEQGKREFEWKLEEMGGKSEGIAGEGSVMGKAPITEPQA